MWSPAGAQSYISAKDESGIGPPISLMQRYVPPAASSDDVSLLIDNTPFAPPAPVAGIAVTGGPPGLTRRSVSGVRAISVSGLGPARPAVGDLRTGRRVIIVSNAGRSR